MRGRIPRLVLSAGFVIIVLMSSCYPLSDVYTSGAFLGTFVGHVVGEDGIPRGLRVETVLESISEFEYSFSGEAYLEGVRYTIEGTETSNGLVHYQDVAPQAVAPTGQVAATFIDTEGVPRYELYLYVPYLDLPFDRVLDGSLHSQERSVGRVELRAGP